MKVPSLAWIVAAAAGALAFVVWRKGGIAPVAQAIGGAAIAAADGVASGVVMGLGEMVGVPRTEASECDRALAEGRLWDASFACPAAQFIAGAYGSFTAPVDQSVAVAMAERDAPGTGAGTSTTGSW